MVRPPPVRRMLRWTLQVGQRFGYPFLKAGATHSTRHLSVKSLLSRTARSLHPRRHACEPSRILCSSGPVASRTKLSVSPTHSLPTSPSLAPSLSDDLAVQA